jgi:beta-N-acetylhexosaminidase
LFCAACCYFLAAASLSFQARAALKGLTSGGVIGSLKHFPGLGSANLDPNLPTSLSPKVVTGIARDQLHFNGVIISDTLWMGGISNTYSLSQAAILAVKAGIDLILGPRGLQDTVTILASMKQAVTSGQLSLASINASVLRIIEMKLHYKILTRAQAM